MPGRQMEDATTCVGDSMNHDYEDTSDFQCFYCFERSPLLVMDSSGHWRCDACLRLRVPNNGDGSC
jgi:hypothetical protein